MQVKDVLRTVEKWKFTVLALGILVIAGGSFFHRPDPTYAEVRRLVGGLSLGCLTSRPNASEHDLLRVRALLQLGPQAYPILGSFLQGRDTKAAVLYMSLRARLPNGIHRHLPALESKDALRMRTKLVIEALGPTACRELVGPICQCIRSEPADAFGQIELLRALNWAIPDSPEAVATLQVWLSEHAPNQHLSTLTAGDWSQIPHLLRLWLFGYVHLTTRTSRPWVWELWDRTLL